MYLPHTTFSTYSFVELIGETLHALSLALPYMAIFSEFAVRLKEKNKPSESSY